MKNERLKSLLLLTLTLSTLSLAQARADEFAPVPNKVLFSDIRDVATHNSEAFPDSRLILEALKTRTSLFFPEGVVYSVDGPGKSRGRITRQMKRKTNTVYNFEMNGAGKILADGAIQYPFIALAHETSRGFYFRKLQVTVAGSPRTVSAVTVDQDIPLRDANFQIEVGLIQRKAVLTEPTLGIKKIYPLGVGSFDLGISEVSRGRNVLMTPTYQRAYLDRNPRAPGRVSPTSAAPYPSYYERMPYMALVKENRRIAQVAFHIVQHGHEAPGRVTDFNHMLRSFDSHGCMRVREKDLYEMYAILMNQGSAHIPVNVNLWVNETADHPFPLLDTQYQQVQNFGTPANPRIDTDHHGLTITEVIQGTPPINLLQEMDASQLSTYDLDESATEPQFAI